MASSLLRAIGLGELVTINRTENALLTLTKYPGLSAAGVFRPGEGVGTTDIVVNVQNERRFDGSVRADNDGTQFTGRERQHAANQGSVRGLVGSHDGFYLFRSVRWGSFQVSDTCS